jgi:hypothetical protein
LKVRFDARRSPTTAVGAALVAVALAAGLSGCTTGDPVVRPSVAATFGPPVSVEPVDPAEAAKEARIEAAQQRYEEYLEITSRLSKKGEDPFWDLMDNGYLSGDEFRKYQQSVWEQFTEKGIRQVGDSIVVSYENVKYKGDPLDGDIARHEVSMDVCLDNTNADFVDPDGKSILQEGFPKRVILNVIMRGMPAGVWAVAADDGDGTAC